MTWRVLINGREVGTVNAIQRESAAYVAACIKFKKQLTYACVVQVESTDG